MTTDSASSEITPLSDGDPQLRHMRMRSRVMSSFSPSTPVKERDLFAGRDAQMMRLTDVWSQDGQHAVVYGERGVGKTSITRVTASILASVSTNVTLLYTCSSDDTFASIWRHILEETPFTAFLKTGIGFGKIDPMPVLHAAAELLGDEVTPNTVRRALHAVTQNFKITLFIDEFDRPTDPKVRGLMADTIKILSDQGYPATVVLVGVADTIDDLIAEHESVQRALVQVQMPRMTDVELAQVIHNGMKNAGLGIEGSVVKEAVQLAQGLPQYAHLLGQHAGVAAITREPDNESPTVRKADLDAALQTALLDVSQTVRDTYHRATQSNRQTLYVPVLLACALATRDELGTFSAADVRDQLQRITNINYDIPAFSQHLKEFSSTDGPRRKVLLKRGTSRRFRYRFINPLLPPYIVMKGRAEGLI